MFSAIPFTLVLVLQYALHVQCQASGPPITPPTLSLPTPGATTSSVSGSTTTSSSNSSSTNSPTATSSAQFPSLSGYSACGELIVALECAITLTLNGYHSIELLSTKRSSRELHQRRRSKLLLREVRTHFLACMQISRLTKTPRFQPAVPSRARRLCRFPMLTGRAPKRREPRAAILQPRIFQSIVIVPHYPRH